MGRGVFITFEGGDGTGKSTQINAIRLALEEFGYETLYVREPGGTKVGEAIRAILLDPANDMSDRTELLLYEAARVQVVCEVIAPALEAGKVVLCDRFGDSTIAYQGYGRGMDIALIARLNEYAMQGICPDRTILLEGDVTETLGRASRHGADRLELAGDEFHARVHAGYRELARESDRIRLVNTCELRADTARNIFHELVDLFPDITEEMFADLIASDHPRFFKGHES